jgi:hypothetical protein
MTAAEWAAITTKPAVMVRRVAASLSPRKLQLLACALCRLIPESAYEPWAIEAIAAAELFAEGGLPAAEFHRVAESVRHACDDLEMRQAVHGDIAEDALSAATAVQCCTGTANLARSIPALMEHSQRFDQITTPRGLKLKSRAVLLARQCHTVREIAINPVAAYQRVVGSAAIVLADGESFEIRESARTLAVAIHSDRAFDRLPILADALEDDGLADPGLLDHLRHGSQHALGCWALDLVLGRG